MRTLVLLCLLSSACAPSGTQPFTDDGGDAGPYGSAILIGTYSGTTMLIGAPSGSTRTETVSIASPSDTEAIIERRWTSAQSGSRSCTFHATIDASGNGVIDGVGTAAVTNDGGRGGLGTCQVVWPGDLPVPLNNRISIDYLMGGTVQIVEGALATRHIQLTFNWDQESPQPPMAWVETETLRP